MLSTRLAVFTKDSNGAIRYAVAWAKLNRYMVMLVADCSSVDA